MSDGLQLAFNCVRCLKNRQRDNIFHPNWTTIIRHPIAKCVNHITSRLRCGISSRACLSVNIENRIKNFCVDLNHRKNLFSFISPICFGYSE